MSSLDPTRGSHLRLWHGLLIGGLLPLAADGLYFLGGVGNASQWSWRLVVAGVGVGLVLMNDRRWSRFGKGLFTGAVASVATIVAAALVTALV